MQKRSNVREQAEKNQKREITRMHNKKLISKNSEKIFSEKM